jgi:hypothetical protein
VQRKYKELLKITPVNESYITAKFD